MQIVFVFYQMLLLFCTPSSTRYLFEPSTWCDAAVYLSIYACVVVTFTCRKRHCRFAFPSNVLFEKALQFACILLKIIMINRCYPPKIHSILPRKMQNKIRGSNFQLILKYIVHIWSFHINSAFVFDFGSF